MNRRISFALILLAGAAVASCGDPDMAPTNGVESNLSTANAAAPATADGGWELLSSGEGTALRLARGDGAAIHLFCPSLSGRLVVNVPGFDAIASEERLSLGSDGTVVALVADSGGDALRGG